MLIFDILLQVGPHPAAALEAINWLGEQGAFDRANCLAQETAGRLRAQALDWWEMQGRGEYWLAVGRKVDEVQFLLLLRDSAVYLELCCAMPCAPRND